jgi:feruloyl esterase
VWRGALITAALAVGLACASLSALAAAQSGNAQLIPLPQRHIELPVMACGALVSHAFPQKRDVAFQLLSASVGTRSPGGAEFCVVKGYVAPQVQFVIYLPTRTYAGRYLQGGCGGMCGVIGQSVTPSCDDPEAFGGTFAVSFNDSGHAGASIADGDWALGAPELRKDYAYRADHVVRIAAGEILTTYYGRAPRWSYFQGCSSGGREALMEALRYPSDFNGIVVGSAFSMPAVMEQFLWDAHVGLTADGREILSPQATALLHRDVIQTCDALDGTRDGQIDDPRLCHYDPARLLCRNGHEPPACLTAAQVGAARLLYQGPMDRQGRHFFPGGQPYGSELTWSQPGGLDIMGLAAGGFIHYLAFPDQLPASFTWRDWKFDLPSYKRLAAASAIYDARSADLRPFGAAGGKMILWQGTADQASGIYGMPEYYQAVQDTVGGLESARAFVRFFLIPGVYHCGGGYIPYQEDFLGAMVNWVELGRAPTRILAVAEMPNGAVRRRPLFAYPERAKYIGGNVDEAKSFVGEMPAKAPDDHYDWVGAYGPRGQSPDP